MTADRLLLGAILAAGAVFSLDSVSVSRTIGYLAGATGIVAVHQRLRLEFPVAISTLTALLLFGATSLFWSMTWAGSPVEALAFGLVAVVALASHYLPTNATQAAAWALVAATPIVLKAAWPPAGGDSSARDAISVLDPLFAPSAGFFSLTPVVYVAAVGMLFMVRRERLTAGVPLGIVLLWTLLTNVFPANGAEPFAHGLTAAIALLAPGLAVVLQYACSKPLLAATPLLVAGALWNYWLMVQYTAGMLPKDEPVSFATLVRQQADVHTRAPYGYPFAFPANVYFAWREGLPVDRYDVLSRVPSTSQFEVVMDRGADSFLLDGWGGAGSTPSGPVRWTNGRRSTIAFALDAIASSLIVEIDASSRVEEPAVGVEVGVDINGHEIGRFNASPAAATTQLIVPAPGVGRLLRAGYNRLTVVNHGIHRIDPGDQRPLGPLATRSADVPYPIAIYKIRVAPAS